MTVSTAIPILLTCLVFSQTPADTAAESPPAVRSRPFGELLAPESPAPRQPHKKPPATAPLGFGKTASRDSIVPNKRTGFVEILPPELIAQAMQPLDGAALSGRSVPLAEVLAYANTPQRQLETVHAYWRLVASVANYNLQCRLVRRLDIPNVKNADLPVLKMARASAAAALEEARCEAISAQHTLAQTAMLPVGQILPLPADLPHVGVYHTHFAEIFSAKTPPPVARLVDRVLPVYTKAIDARGRAIAASRKSFDAVLKSYRAGISDIDAVVARAASLNRQQRALVVSVCQYNHEIAEYAVASLSRPVNGPVLVSMLIKTKNTSASGLSSLDVPATASRTRNQPTLAPPRGAVRRLSHDEPIQNPLRDVDTLEQSPPTDEEPFRLDPPDVPAKPLTPVDPDYSSSQGTKIEVLETPVPSRPAHGDTPVIRTRPVEPVLIRSQPALAPALKPAWETTIEQTPAAEGPKKRSASKPLFDSRGELKKPAAKGLYASLQNASASDRAARLTDILHADFELPIDTGRRVELSEYLAMGTDRQAMAEAYWLVRQRAAEYQTLDGQRRLLGELSFSAAPPCVKARLEAVRTATEAEMADAHARLIQSQYRLADLVGKTSEPAWLFPATRPHAMPYNPEAVAPRRDIRTQRNWPSMNWPVQNWPVQNMAAQRIAATVPMTYSALCRRADAVVETDSARAAAVCDLQATASMAMKPGNMENRVLDLTIRETEETMAMLATLTKYNNAVYGF